MRALLVMCAALAVNCGRPPATDPDHVPPHRERHIAPELEEAAVEFAGTCEWARGPGELSQYTLHVRTIVDAVVRSDARFDGADRTNVLGEIPSDTELVAIGPVMHPRYDWGEGFAVLVQGHTGRVCRGYVRASTVAPM